VFKSRLVVLATGQLSFHDIEDLCQTGYVKLIESPTFGVLCAEARYNEVKAFVLTTAGHVFQSHIEALKRQPATVRIDDNVVARRLIDRRAPDPSRAAALAELLDVVNAIFKEVVGELAPLLMLHLVECALRLRPQREVLAELGLSRHRVRHLLAKVRAHPRFPKWQDTLARDAG
jgi:DNA-directed RNA polymerase specialized sigma24 family protein